MDWMPQAVRDGIIVILVISGPIVLTAAFIGLSIGILQAATQVQEQTIGSALKIIGVFGLIIFAGFWMFQYLNRYAARTLTTAFQVVPHLTQKAIPRGSSEEGFKERLDQNLGSFDVEPPEKLEAEGIGGAIPPPGAPFLGRPKPPSIPAPSSDILPPMAGAGAVVMPIQPKIPILDYQEPMILPPVMPNIQEERENLSRDLVPGEPVVSNDEINPNLWEREEEFAEEIDKDLEEELPTWIN